MVSLTKMLRSDMERAFGSFRFPLAVVLFALARLSTGLQDMILYGETARNKLGVLGYSFFFLHSNVSIISTAICCFPFVAAYLEDRESRFSSFLQSRTSMKTYIRSKAVTSYVSAQVTAFLGYALVTLIVAFYVNFSKGHLMGGGSSSEALNQLASSAPAAYFLLFFIHNSAIQGIWALFALSISAFVQNLYLTLALSYTANILFVYLTRFGFHWLILSARAYGGAFLAENIPLWQGAGLNGLQIAMTCFILFQVFKSKLLWDWKVE